MRNSTMRRASIDASSRVSSFSTPSRTRRPEPMRECSAPSMTTRAVVTRWMTALIHQEQIPEDKSSCTVQRTQEDLLDLAVHLADVSGVDFPGAAELGERNNGLCHRGVPAGGPDASKGLFQDAAGGSNIAHIADRDNVVR